MNISECISWIKQKPVFWKIKILYNEIFRIRGKNNVIIKQRFYGKVKLYIVGNNNTVKIGQNVIFNNIPIHIRGNNHHVEILNNVRILGGIFYVKETVMRLLSVQELLSNRHI